jgi:hypothetical protein
MPDTNTATPPPSETAKSKRNRSLINQAHAAELTLAGELVNTARKTTYAPKLADEEIDGPFIDALVLKIDQANSLLASAGGKTAEKKTTTDNEEELKETLLELIGKVQARAKRKYAKAGDPQRAKYYIGQHIGNSRPLLEASSQAIIERLATDTLPGMKPGGPDRVASRARRLHDRADHAVRRPVRRDHGAQPAGRESERSGRTATPDPIRRRRRLAGDEEDQRRSAHGVQDPARPRVQVR